MQRYRLRLEYDGAFFHGWQRQEGQLSVQEVLETALERVCGHPVRVIGAGRTDAGVHASGQVAHFDTQRPRDGATLRRAVNALTPVGVTVLEVMETTPDFHARFDATQREYVYRILNRASPPALERDRVWHVRQPLDVRVMAAALTPLLGTHDFSAFRAAACQARNPVRTLTMAEVIRQGEEVHLRFGANAFLHHMVRNLVGSVVKVGRGEVSEVWLKELLDGRDRTRAAATAPPQGLVLTRVVYPGDEGGIAPPSL